MENKTADTNLQQTTHHSTHKHLITAIATLLLLVVITTGVVLYGMGYRLNINGNAPILAHTGILNVTSNPTGAEVWVNHHPTTATTNTINLTPGKYTIDINKDGYTNWEKDILIQDQVVSNISARLFPTDPTLQSIATIGITNPVLDPSGTKLAFNVASGSAETKNGIYVLDMTARSFPVLPIQSSATQIVSDTTDTFSNAKLSWSPDGQQIVASISASQNPTVYLLQANTFNTTPQDVTATLPTIEANWKTQENDKNISLLAALKPMVLKLLNNFNIIAWSPDETKILYQANTSTTLPLVVTPRRIGNNLLYEQRTISKGGIYVYDIHEDVNTRILDTTPVACDITQPTCATHLTWFPDSNHLIYVNDKKIHLVETDGANMTTLYAGPFENDYVFPWPDGSKLVIVTNLNNTSIPPTLYTISL